MISKLVHTGKYFYSLRCVLQNGKLIAYIYGLLAALHNHRANAGKFNFLNSEKKNLFLYFKFNLRDNQFNFTNVLCIERENKIGILWHINICMYTVEDRMVCSPAQHNVLILWQRKEQMLDTTEAILQNFYKNYFNYLT